jgi:PAS domain S-box-containing protein
MVSSIFAKTRKVISNEPRYRALFTESKVIQLMSPIQTTRNILDAIDDISGLGLFEYQAETDTLFVSDGWRRIFEVGRSEVFNMRESFQFFDEPYRSQLLVISEDISKSSLEHSFEQTLTLECTITTKQGRKRWLRLHNKRFLQDDIVISRGFLQDISPEREKQITSEQFQHLYHSAPCGYCSINLDNGRITRFNSQLLAYLGYDEKDLPWHFSIETLLAPETAAVDNERIRKVLEQSGLHQEEIIIVRKDSSRFWAMVGGAIERNPAGKPIAGHLMVVDISERKENEELRSSSIAENEVKRMKSEFLSMMSHEFRTPMGVVLGATDVLRDHVSEEGGQYLDMLEASAKRLMTMLNNVLELATTEFDSSAASQPLQRTDTLAFCQKLLEYWENRMKKRGLTFTIDLTPSVPRMVVFDKLRLEKILNNILDNALKFTEQGFVSLRLEYDSDNTTSTADGWLQLTIQDSGIGIAEEHCEAIFEPFYQVHHGITRRYDGAGIGLTVVRTLLKQIKGTIQITSIVGTGTTLKLSVPVMLH